MGIDYKPDTLLNLSVDQFIHSSQLYKADPKEKKTETEKSVNLSKFTQPVIAEVGFETGQYGYRAYIPNHITLLILYNFMMGTGTGLRIIYQVPNHKPEQQFRHRLCVKAL